MLPGPMLIKKCTACKTLIQQDTLRSGNTFGATFWTDGKRDAPMLPDSPWLVKCPHCGELLWIDELEQVGEVDFMNGEEGFSSAKSYRYPSSKDYYAILNSDGLDDDKRRYLRVRAWWLKNDAVRKGKTSKMTGTDKKNLLSLLSLLDESNQNDQLMRCEIFRELGEFEKAAEALSGDFDSELDGVVSFMSDLVKKEHAEVAEIIFDR